MNSSIDYTSPQNLSAAYAEMILLKENVSLAPSIQALGVVAGLATCYRIQEKELELVLSVYSWKGELLHLYKKRGIIQFPQASLLLGYRALPLILRLIEESGHKIDGIMIKGYGVNHPEQFGLACHLGLILNIPVWALNDKRHPLLSETIPDSNSQEKPQRKLFQNGALCGYAVRTQAKLKPLFISPGHKLSCEQAKNWSLHFVDKHKWPEPLRICINTLNEYYRQKRLAKS